MKYIEDILKGVISGILSSYLIVYGLRPSVQYPDYILDMFENKWVFILLIICNYYIFIWDNTCGCLMLLGIVSLMMDYIIFTERSNNSDNTTRDLLHDLSGILFQK
jgi:Ca2+/Na+ antiporter